MEELIIENSFVSHEKLFVAIDETELINLRKKYKNWTELGISDSTQEEEVGDSDFEYELETTFNESDNKSTAGQKN